MVLPVLVINRAVDEDRLTRFTTSARAFGLLATRIDAADAHRPDFPFALYADLLRDRFWDTDQIKLGAIGCFLSHRRAWQHVVDHDLPMALICEDDAELLTAPGSLQLAASALPGFDVIFANARMASWCRAIGDFDLKPLPQVINDLAQAGGPKVLGVKPTPGGDCYLISRNGAKALLDRTAQQGIRCGVDWAMVWNGVGDVSSQTQTAFPELRVLATHSLAPPPPLKMYAVANPVADQRKGPSVLKHAVSVPIADLTHRDSMLAHAEAVSTVTLGTAQLCFACRSGPDPVMEMHRAGNIWDEPGLTALLRRFPAGGCFVDVGTHSGNHAVVMARLGAASRIIAFEPNAEIHRLLHTNMAINGVAGRLELHAGIALSGKPGTGYLFRNRKRSSETMVKIDAPQNQEAPQDTVQMLPGDTLLAGQAIHAIKIDTSGSEVDVVKGLRQTLAVQRPLLLLDHGAQAQDRIERLADEIGYTVAETHASSRKNRGSSLLLPQASPPPSGEG